MPDIFRPTYHAKIPAHAKTFTRRGRRFARFTQTTGRIVEGEVLPNGKRCRIETAEYYARVREADGRIRRVALGVADKAAAFQLAAKLRRDADHGKAGLIDPMVEHRRRPLIGSMQVLPKRKPERDQRGRVIRSASELAHADLEQAIAESHLADYRTHLLAAGRTSRHVWEVVRVIRRVCIACRFNNTAALDANVFDKYLAGLVAAGKSYRTRNSALKSIRAFVRYLVKSDRLAKDPFRTLAAINEEGDPRRRRRRALEPHEFSQLIAAAENGKKIEAVSGAERALLYLVAAWTGLRRKELSELKASHCSLKGNPPFIHVPASSTKAKRDDHPIPLHPIVAEKLRSWIMDRKLKASDRIFHLRTASGQLRRTSKMMERDCQVAGITYAGDLGIVDFHSHRVGFITALCRTADFSTVVDLARHSDPKLTSKIYDRVRLENRVAAINGLPLPTESVPASRPARK